MKNLNILRTSLARFKRRIVAQCADFDNKRLFALTEDFTLLLSQSGGAAELRVNPIEDGFDLKSLKLQSVVQEDVILMEFVVELGAILIALRGGHFIQVAVSSFSPPSGCIYKHAKELLSVQLSPEQDLIALVDIESDIYILGTDYSVIHSANALTQNESLHKPVGVGWGSKETQFFGLDGRPAKEKENQDKIVLSELERRTLERIESSPKFKQYRARQRQSNVLDWRGDGQFLASLTLIPDTSKHYLKVWNRNLELQYMSEQLVTMEGGLLSWIPNGQYVCCAQRRDQCVNEIAMFEKNGMVHQRITLPQVLPNFYIYNMSWSPDSKILAIIGLKFSLINDTLKSEPILLLYTMQNFRYYLKHTSYLEPSSGFFIKWDPISTFKLYISTADGVCLEFVCNSRVDYLETDSTVVVVDADKILVTPFRICNIPPPMSAIEIKMDSLISRVVTDSKTNRIYVSTLDGTLYMYGAKHQSEQTKSTLKVCVKSIQVNNWSDKFRSLRCIEFKDAHDLMNWTLVNDRIIATKQVDECCEIHEFKLTCEDGQIKGKVIKRIPGRQVTAVLSRLTNNQSKVVLILNHGYCIDLNLETLTESSHPIRPNNDESFTIIDAAFIDGPNTAKGPGLVTLAQDQTLRMNDRLVASGSCTSFRVDNNFIIYTTAENYLHFVPIASVTNQSSCDLNSWNQAIELGGTLIAVQDSKVVLQMPRGNLETVHPRILVLLSIINQLDEQRYLAAMKQARRHRLDLNFLIDLMIRRDGDLFFSEKLKNFCRDLIEEDSSLLNLLINELENSDTLADRYKGTVKFLQLQDQILEPHSFVNTKVHSICKALEEYMNEQYKDELQPKLLSLLRQVPRRTDTALREISKLCEKDKNSALRFLLYFINVDQLFLDALGTYDTDLALMVAGVSTKDPKEYLALLDQFNEVEHEHLRKFMIDLHIKNFEKAFQNILLHALTRGPEEEESITQKIIDLVEDTRLYKFATREIRRKQLELSNHETGEPYLKRLEPALWLKYADYLSKKRYDLEAGLACSKAFRLGHRNKEVAYKMMNCFINCWDRPLLILADEDFGLMKDLHVNNMLKQDRIAEGAIVMQNIKSNKLAESMMSMHSWYMASYVATDEYRHTIRDEIAVKLIGLLDLKQQTLVSEFEEAQKLFERLKILIRTPQTQKKRQLDADNCPLPDSLSTIDGSEASSIWQGSQESASKKSRPGAPSIKTRVSSKSTKSQASRAKRINLKSGSRFEDIAIILELKKFVEKQKADQESTRDLIATFFDFTSISQLDNALKLLAPILNSSLELANEITSQLWPKEDRLERPYSLYKRYKDMFTGLETLDNVDFEVLVRPELVGATSLLEL